MANDVYVIERDERDIGGGFKIIARFDSWLEASKAWNLVHEDDDPNVFMWLLRFKAGESSDPLKAFVLDCKVK